MDLLSPEALEFAKNFGFPALLVVFMLMMGVAGYWHVVRRLNKSEDFIRSTLSSMLKDVTGALRDNTAAHRESAKMHASVLDAMQNIPCFKRHEDGDYRPHRSDIMDAKAPQEPPTTALHQMHG